MNLTKLLRHCGRSAVTPVMTTVHEFNIFVQFYHCGTKVIKYNFEKYFKCVCPNILLFVKVTFQ